MGTNQNQMQANACKWITDTEVRYKTCMIEWCDNTHIFETADVTRHGPNGEELYTYLSLLEFTPREGVKHSGSGRPVEVGNRKTVRLHLQLELLHAQEQLAILVLQLFMPELVLLHPCELVLQQFYILHRRFENRTLVRPDVPNNLVIPAKEKVKQRYFM